MISVIIPVYNVEKYIEKCVRSVINQTYGEFEIIIVDDGSTDKSLDICNKLADEDKRINIISQKNTGSAMARNIGLHMSSGEWIMFLDDDDWLDEDCFEKLISRCTDDLDIIMFPFIKEYNKHRIKVEIFKEYDRTFDKNEIDSELIRRLVGPIGNELSHPEKIEIINPTWNKLYRKKCIEDIRYIDIKKIGTEDLWFNLQAFKKARRVAYTNSTYYHYNKDNCYSQTQTYNIYLFNGWKNLYSMIWEYIETNYPRQDAFREAINNRIVVNLLGLTANIVCSKLCLNDKCKELKIVLYDSLYNNAFESFKFDELGLIWKIFYMFCRQKNVCAVYFMIYASKKLLSIVR